MKIAIASGKGGTGKTTVSVNLANYMAEESDIILVDLDVEEPNSGLFINSELVHRETKYKMIPTWIEDDCTFCGLCQRVCNFNAVINMGKMIMVFPELCHSCYACSELCPKDSLPMEPKAMGELKHFKTKKLDFIESKLIIGEEQAVPLISQTKKYIKDNIPNNAIIIYDSPPGTSCPVIEATKDSDFVILVTEPTPFGLHDLKLAVETMEELEKDFGVVINRIGIGNDDVKIYCEQNDIPIIALIKNDIEIAKLYATGKLIYNEIPEFKASLDEIKNYLMDYQKQMGI